MKLIYYYILALVTASLSAEDPKKAEDMSLLEITKTSSSYFLKTENEDKNIDEIVNTEITVASMKFDTLREAPGIVTVISGEEIRNSGARDLIDVLNLIPGFSFASDVEGVVGLGVRGNWAHEGKVLLLIDSLEMNELRYTSLQFGNHYPVENIRRIEIIRGPGSAIYGGYAEMAVINIITKNELDLDGISIHGSFGQMGKDFENYYQRSAALSFGKTFGDLKIVSHLIGLSGNRSDANFTDIDGNSFKMLGNNGMNTWHWNSGLDYKNLNLRFILDSYNTTMRDGFDQNLPRKLDVWFDSYLLGISYRLKLTDRLTLTPKLTYSRFHPWFTDPDEYERYKETAYKNLFGNDRIERFSGELAALYAISNTLSLSGGLQYKYDLGTGEEPKENAGFKDLGNVLDYTSFAGYLQGVWKTVYANLTIGARIENHSEAGTSFVPRLALTKAFTDFHLKALFSKAYRAPSITNISEFSHSQGKGSIKPENTTVLEMEAGYKAFKKLFLTANFFYIRIDDPIVYYYIDDDSYDNYDLISTIGTEIELKYKDKWGYVTASYSFSKPHDNKVDQYEVPEIGQLKTGDYTVNKNYLLGFPNHKITLNGSVNPWKSLYINPSLIIYGKKYGFKSTEEVLNDDGKAEEYLVIGKFDPEFLLNLNILYRDAFMKGLTLGVAAHNILQQKQYYVQPYYDGYHAALPGPSAEIMLHATYDLNF